MISTIFNETITIVDYSLKVFLKFGMVEQLNHHQDEQTYCIKNWEKHQSIDRLEKVKEQDKIRALRYREKQKTLLLSSRDDNVTLTEKSAPRTRTRTRTKNKSISNDIHTENFEMFWKAYPVKKKKQDAKIAFAKIDTGLFAELMSGLENLKQNDTNWINGDYIPHPTTFLNQQRWTDEPRTKLNKNSKFQNNVISNSEKLMQRIKERESHNDNGNRKNIGCDVESLPFDG